jgi:hypothetical protein
MFQWRNLVLAAALAIWGGSCAAAEPLTIQAWDATIKTAGGKIDTTDQAEAGWNLWSEGDLGDYIQFPAEGAYKLVVRARGSVAKGVWPLMAVMLDGRQIAVATVDKKDFADYAFDFKAPAGTHRLVVSFLNDAVTPDLKHPGSPPWLEDGVGQGAGGWEVPDGLGDEYLALRQVILGGGHPVRNSLERLEFT